MIDLSNNNPPVDFRAVREAGHRRVYLKASEGLHFADATYRPRKRDARAAGIRVGAYHFAHATNDPRAEARRFHELVGRDFDLRPVLDYEAGIPSQRWTVAFLAEAHRLFGVTPMLYSYADFVRRMQFRAAPAWLWLASYGRDNGREYPFAPVHPFAVAAHQYTSRGTVAGCRGYVDVSHVFRGDVLNV